MGTGKTTVGRALAARTGWPYEDNDLLLQRLTGRSAPDLLAEQGEAALRAGERAVLDAVLALPPPLVAGVAGGVVVDPSDRRRVRDGGHVVWLRARPETLARRVGAGAGRPWLGDDPLGVLQSLVAARAPLYAEVATQVLDVDDRTAHELAEQVLDRLRGQPFSPAP